YYVFLPFLHDALPIFISSRLLYSFRISSAYFCTLTFLVRFFSRFSRLLAPMAFSSSLPALSMNQRMFSSTLSYSPGSQHRPPLRSEEHTSELQSRFEL